MSAHHAERLGRADLHVHTTWSDDSQRPEAMVAAASGRVDVLAITDHDEIRGRSRPAATRARSRCSGWT